LQIIRNFSTFTGLGSINEGQGSCDYRVSDLGPLESKLIELSGTVGVVTRYAEITIDDIDPTLNITSWREVSFISGF